jgi:hypothetical protein
MIGSVGVYAIIVLACAGTVRPLLPQAETLLWGLAFVAAVNLLTIMPTYRAMMERPRNAYVRDGRPESLLRAHLIAHSIALARIEAIAIFGFVLFFLTGRRDWFFIFASVAAAGLLLLWPSRSKLIGLVGLYEPPFSGR